MNDAPIAPRQTRRCRQGSLRALPALASRGKRMTLRAICSLALFGFLALPWSAPATAQNAAPPRDTVNLVLDVTNPANLSILLAEDRLFRSAVDPARYPAAD